MTERVVELLEVVDVDQPHRQSGSVAFGAAGTRDLGHEGLLQTAAVRHRGQCVGRHLVGKPPQLGLQRAHLALELTGAGVVLLHAPMRTLNQGAHRAAFVDEFLDDAGQALQGLGARDRLGVAADTFAEAPGVFVERTEFAEQALDQVLQGAVGRPAFVAHTPLLREGLTQQFVWPHARRGR